MGQCLFQRVLWLSAFVIVDIVSIPNLHIHLWAFPSSIHSTSMFKRVFPASSPTRALFLQTIYLVVRLVVTALTLGISVPLESCRPPLWNTDRDSDMP